MNRSFSLIVLGWVAGSLFAQAPLAERVAAVTQRSEYQHARWGYLFVDSGTGEVLLERMPDQMFVPASTTKLYSCAAALGVLGPAHRFETRILARGDIMDHELKGDLILVASGDLTLGGRTRPDGTMAFCNGDHTYADARSTNAAVTDTDSLAGLNDLAKQVKDAGIDGVTGDVLIDDRLFDHAQGSGSGPRSLTPILVNDNVIDFVISASGDQVAVTMRPETAYVQVDNRVRVGAGYVPEVNVVNEGPRRISLRGTIPSNGKAIVRIWPVDDPAAFARCLLIECLRKRGVDVAASAISVVHENLPSRTVSGELPCVARFQSPPLSEVTKVTLKVSHNLYASTLPLLLAVKTGQRTLSEGLRVQHRFLKDLGLNTSGASFAGGAGGAPADSTSPRTTVELLRLLQGRPEFEHIRDGLPILGIDGTLANVVPVDCLARGHVRGKTGTLIWSDLFNNRSLLRSKALAGVIEAKSGRKLTFALFVNDVPLGAGVTSEREGRALGEICAIVYEHAP